MAGLRREEVALLAGISANYCLRLEQGRDRHPSAQVLEARALRLDATEAAHLSTLGRPQAGEAQGARAAIVPASIELLLQAVDLPAFVQDPHFDVVASNAMARAFSPTLRPGRNRMLSAVPRSGGACAVRRLGGECGLPGGFVPCLGGRQLVGAITLTRDNLAVDGAERLQLVLYHAGLRPADLGKLAQLRDKAGQTHRG